MYCEHCFTVSPDKSTRCIQCGKGFIEEKPKLQSPTKKSNDGLGMYAGFAGLAIGLYSGIFVLLMMAAYWVTSWLGKKFFNSKTIPYLQTFAIQASLIIVPATFAFFLNLKGLMPLTLAFLLIDILLPSFGLIWLIKKPGIKAVIALSIFQLIVLSVNFINISEMDIGSQNHQALANYIVWRIGALYFLWTVYFQQKNNISHATEQIS